jgi:hypothetical protein
MPDINLQDKTVTPQQNAQVVVADAEFAGLNKVTVEAIPTAEQAIPAIEVDDSGLITASVIQDAGYVLAGTISVTEQLPVQEAQTIMPGATDKTIEAGKYLTGIQTIKGDVNLIADNIAKDIAIFGVVGTHQGGEDVSAELTEQDDIIALMQEAIATKSAAGVAEPFAVIGVTYPEGSTCTCTDGVEEFTAKDTSGQAIFVIPYVGTWIITATDDTNTSSETVEITSEGQSVNVELDYVYYLFKEGDLTKNKMVYRQANANSTTVTIDNDYIQVTRHNTTQGEVQFYSEEKHDLSKYSTLYFDVSIQNVYVYNNNTTRCGIFSTPPINNAEPGTSVAVTQINSNDSRKTYSVDLSRISASSWPLYVGFGGSFSGKIYNIWAK